MFKNSGTSIAIKIGTSAMTPQQVGGQGLGPWNPKGALRARRARWGEGIASKASRLGSQEPTHACMARLPTRTRTAHAPPPPPPPLPVPQVEANVYSALRQNPKTLDPELTPKT